MALTHEEKAELASLQAVDAGMEPSEPPTLADLRARGHAEPDRIALTAAGRARLEALKAKLVPRPGM